MRKLGFLQVTRTASRLGLSYIRVFGSSVKSSRSARDLDVVIGPKRLGFRELSELAGVLEKYFRKPADIVQFRAGLSPFLVREIAGSKVLWEKPRVGRADWAIAIDQYLAIAEDDLLAFPVKDQVRNLKKIQRGFRVA